MSSLHIKNNLLIDGSSVFTGTADLAGGALNTDLVTNFNADLLDGAELSTDGTLADNSDAAVPTEKAVKTYADARKAECVALTGDQTVNGIKTLGSIPVLPASDPTADNEAVRKAYVDGASVVHIAGNETIAGVKTFSAQPALSYGSKVNGYIHAASVTLNTVFDTLAPFLPNTGNTMLVTGICYEGFALVVSRAERINSTTIRLYGLTSPGGIATLDAVDGSATIGNASLAW